MVEFLQSVVHIVGVAGSGGNESSPLSVESPFAEMIRLIQVGIFAGVLYLIKGLKETKSVSTETHDNILGDLKNLTEEIQRQRKERKEEIQVLRDEVGAIATRKEEASR